MTIAFSNSFSNYLGRRYPVILNLEQPGGSLTSCAVADSDGSMAGEVTGGQATHYVGNAPGADDIMIGGHNSLTTANDYDWRRSA
jgi:hypothetical protein